MAILTAPLLPGSSDQWKRANEGLIVRVTGGIGFNGDSVCHRQLFGEQRLLFRNQTLLKEILNNPLRGGFEKSPGDFDPRYLRDDPICCDRFSGIIFA